MENSNGKYATITIRTTDQEKAELLELAREERRTLGGFVYLVLIDFLRGQRNDEKEL